MRIVVSGTHASGKSTLIADFAARHPEYVVLADPFESLDEEADAPGVAMFGRQLRVAADRLLDADSDDLIAERGPVDFIAYLLAMPGSHGHGDAWERAMALTASAMRRVDLLVVLLLDERDPIDAGDDEHLALRSAMQHALLDLLDDSDAVPSSVRVLELVGDREARVRALEAALG